MKSTVFDMVSKMDMNDIELQLVMQCAPVIAGIKISNLLIIKTETLFSTLDILKSTHLCYFLLRKDAEKTTILLYNPEKIKAYLERDEIVAFLKQLGYKDCSLGQVLSVFRIRYQNYMKQPRKFPHEMGILLGYPMEDVTGFMKNKGKNFLYMGYWKVYENLSDKIQLFRRYEMAKEQQVRMIYDGIEMSEIIRWYRFAGKQICLL